MSPLRIFHVALRSDWSSAQAAGAYAISTRDVALAQTGFVHCSTADQLPAVLTSFYADLDPSELVVLVLDPERVEAAGSPLRWETEPGTRQSFPHVYGPLSVSAVIAVLAVGGRPGAPERPDLTGWNG